MCATRSHSQAKIILKIINFKLCKNFKKVLKCRVSQPNTLLICEYQFFSKTYPNYAAQMLWISSLFYKYHFYKYISSALMSFFSCKFLWVCRINQNHAENRNKNSKASFNSLVSSINKEYKWLKMQLQNVRESKRLLGIKENIWVSLCYIFI